MAEGGKNQLNVAMSLPPPPIFGTISNSSGTMGEHKHTGAPISLDDIFDDFIFDKVDSKSKMNAANVGMGVASSGASSSGSGRAMGNGADDMDDREDDGYDSMLDDDDDDDEDGEGRKKKRARGLNKNMTEEQKVERRYSRRGSLYFVMQLFVLRPCFVYILHTFHIGNVIESMPSDHE